MIKYQTTAQSITADNLNGFFVGWPTPPSSEKLLKLLENSYKIVLAIDDSTGNVIGFINAISDKTLSAYIPLLEVLPPYQKQGIGSELVKKMLEQLQDFYMIDLCCDTELNEFYSKFNFSHANAQIIRNRHILNS